MADRPVVEIAIGVAVHSLGGGGGRESRAALGGWLAQCQIARTWRRDVRKVVGCIVAGVGFAAAGDGGRVRHRGRSIAGHVHGDGEGQVAAAGCQCITAGTWAGGLRAIGPTGTADACCGQPRGYRIGYAYGTAGRGGAAISDCNRIRSADLALCKIPDMRLGDGQVRHGAATRSAHHLHLSQAEIIRAAQLHPYILALGGWHSDGSAGVRLSRLVAAPGAGPVLQSGRCIGRQERCVGDKHPVVAEAIPAAIGPIPDHHRTDAGRCPQVNLPPGVGIRVRVADRPVVEIAIGVAVHSLGGGGGSESRAALGGCLAQGQVGSARAAKLKILRGCGIVCDRHPVLRLRTISGSRSRDGICSRWNAGNRIAAVTSRGSARAEGRG